MGASVFITGRNKSRLNDTFDKLEGQGHIQISADLSSDDSVRQLVSMLPQLDGFVNSAGIADPRLFQYVDEEYMESVFGINFSKPVMLLKYLTRGKILNKNSSVVFVSSVSGNAVSFIGGSIYSASKAAINGFIKGLALELAPKLIRVNSIMPGMIDTGIFNESSISAQQLEEDKLRYPLGRFGKPEDVAFAAIYLLSDASSWVTGTNLLIDGGYTLK